MQHRILGTVYTLLNENTKTKKKIKKICAANFQILEDRQKREASLREKVEAMRTL